MKKTMPPNSSVASVLLDACQVGYDIVVESSLLFRNNNNALPIDISNNKAAIFGRTQVNTIRGGKGSSDVNIDNAEYVNIIDGIRTRGVIDYFEPLARLYETWVRENPPEIDNEDVFINSEMPLSDYPDIARDAAVYTDTAIVIIGRSSGEFHDRTDSDYYLTQEERNMLQTVSDNFEKVIVVLNIASFIDMQWVNDYNPDAVLGVWLPGYKGGLPVADLLSGTVYPSGKLTGTWAVDINDYPTRSAVVNANMENGNGTWGQLNVNPVYVEDIYVGYRYFETFAPEKVAYEFGYGMSYTTFEQEIIRYDDSIEGTISVEVRISNIGIKAGKEVVQVYFSAPRGKLGKPAKELIAYKKTDEIQPGEEQRVILSFDVSQMSSYDDSGVTGYPYAYVMEAGNYEIYVGNSVKNVELAGTYSLSSKDSISVMVEQLSQQAAVEETDVFRRLTVGENGEIAFEAVPTREIPLEDIVYDDPPEIPQTGDVGLKLSDIFIDPNLMDAFIAQLTDEEMAWLTCGNPSVRFQDYGPIAGGFGGWNGEDPSGSDLSKHGVTLTADGNIEAGVGNQNAKAGPDLTMYGINAVKTVDGPAGIRLLSISLLPPPTPNIQFPSATAAAATFNIALIEQEGVMIAKEANSYNIDIWLAPGLNIHRDPLSGRNFEYYSEDPLVSGMSAAAVTQGAQSRGMQVILKHFAANNQETDRKTSNSILSERALREIYLKGFEIAVKKTNVSGVMAAYPMINGSHGASNYETLTNILRKEWGFDGLVMSDWNPNFDNGQGSMVRAQCEIRMPEGYEGNAGQVLEGLSSGLLTRGQLQRGVKNILNTMMRSNSFRDANGY